MILLVTGESAREGVCAHKFLCGGLSQDPVHAFKLAGCYRFTFKMFPIKQFYEKNVN